MSSVVNVSDIAISVKPLQFTYMTDLVSISIFVSSFYTV